MTAQEVTPAPTMTAAATALPYAVLEAGILVIGNHMFERRWRLCGAGLHPSSVVDRINGREWISQGKMHRHATETCPATEPEEPVLRQQATTLPGSSTELFQAELVISAARHKRTYRFATFADLPAISFHQVDGPPMHDTDPDVVERLGADLRHCWLLHTQFTDQTDIHDNLVHETWFALHPSERLELVGNLSYIEHRPSGSGLALIKVAPSPESRTPTPEVDLELSNKELLIRGSGAQTAVPGYPHWMIAYAGGTVPRIAAIQGLQQRLRPYVAGRDGLLLSNTWGDRSRDSRISEEFVLKEIAAAEQAGADAVQIDDGWQKGTTKNSAHAEGGGAWNHFWSTDPEFWSVHPKRFPRNLEPAVKAADDAGLGLGLWYAPDSSDEFANWERDAERILDLWREHGVRHIKIDAVRLASRVAGRRLTQLYDRVICDSNGDITLDSDVTGQHRRPGFWGELTAGPVFVENRYTDMGTYWPHHTLRNLWLLAHHVHPVRLRMEFLNPDRNQHNYSDDPLAPAKYSPATLFATVMFASPLAWMELSSTTDHFRRELSDIVRVWKTHRAAIYASTILPIGGEPDGYTWTGFLTYRSDGDLYALIFRELSDERTWSFPLARPGITGVELLSGHGSAMFENGRVVVAIDHELGFAFIRLTTENQ